MAKWMIPDNRDRKLIRELREALAAYVETDETPLSEETEYGEIKRRAITVLKSGGPR